MKNWKNLVVVVLAFLAFEVCPYCASPKIENNEYGKSIYSKRKISDRDFATGNFFINEIGNSAFNVKIFNMMKNLISNGTAKYLVADEELNEECKALVKKGEFIDCVPNDTNKNLRLIVYYIFDKKSKHFVLYNFALTINESQYNSYAQSVKTLTSLIAECNKNIDLCDKNIKTCNEIIEKCSNPTIRKSRVVKVPRTYEITNFVPGKAGNPGSHVYTDSITEYVDKIEYYTVPDPNYNPTAVAKAKKDLQSWNNSKNSWSDKKYAAEKEKRNLPLPFTLNWWMPNDDSNFHIDKFFRFTLDLVDAE